jgi:NDP-sugar pyrophosphorylase family protein
MKAVLLIGGAGTRMRPLTYVMPKCLLPLGGKPLLERTIQYLGAFGVNEYVLCVAYLKKQIIDAFGDGSRLGVKIRYAEADVPLGTAGQLKTAEPYVADERFLVLNGDIVTNLNISALLSSHEKTGAMATIAVKRFEVKIPYGHIMVKEGGLIEKFEEKPTLSYLANAGIYAMQHGVFASIPVGKQCSIEREVFPSLLEKGDKVGYYYEDAYWADVGSMGDFERVNDDISSIEQGLADVK